VTDEEKRDVARDEFDNCCCNYAIDLHEKVDALTKDLDVATRESNEVIKILGALAPGGSIVNMAIAAHTAIGSLKEQRDALKAENDELRAKKEKIAPVQGYSAGIPWVMHLRAYDAYCKKYGPQEALISLEGRNCRGGFSTSELDVFIPGWREELSELHRLRAALDKATGPVTDEEWPKTWEGHPRPSITRSAVNAFIAARKEHGNG
jgi:hypothetical protein